MKSQIPCLLASFLMLFAACSGSASKNTSEQNGNSAATASVIPAFDTNSLDRKYRPQDDFDSFANGNWKRLNPVPETEGNWGAFGILDKENTEVKLKSIIEGALKTEKPEAGSDVQKIADMYRAFMDTLRIERLGLKPLQSYIGRIEGIKTLDDWAQVNGEMQKIGVSSVLGIYVDADDRNSRMNAVKWVQSGLSLGEKGFYSSRDDMMKNIRNEFVSHVDRMISISGKQEADAGKRMLKFETALAAIQLSNVETRDPVKTYNKISTEKLETLVKNFSLKKFSEAQDILSDTVIVQNTNYIKNLSKLLNSESLSNLKLYTYYKLLIAYSNYLPKAYKDEKFAFYGKIKGGIKEQKKRDIQAVDITESLGEGNILGRLYVQKYFPESSKKKVAEMIENVRAVYGERIKGLQWMSDSTKNMAMKKLSTFTYKIGFPDSWDDYGSISIHPETLIENIISNTLWSHAKMAGDVGKPVDRKRWYMPPQTVNAYYNPLNNEIVFPAGILQAPFFNPDADDAVNYGGIIAVIGHEFTHGFDDQGAQYDETGNLRNWWSDQDLKNFNSLGERYIAYFNQFEPLPGIHINGSLTIGENIADLGGLTLAYYALKRSLAGKNEPEPIDGFTWQQRFYLSWAQVWHNNIKDEELRNRLQTDPHAPARYRINGPLKHLREFHEAFDVKEGDGMWIPESERVSIW